jgi:hypothetical protein
MERKLRHLHAKHPVETICCTCKGFNSHGVKVNHLLDHHGDDFLRGLRDLYHQQPSEEARKSFLKRCLRPEWATPCSHVSQFELDGHYLCWDGAKKLFGVSRNLLSCVANTPQCVKYGEFLY